MRRFILSGVPELLILAVAFVIGARDRVAAVLLAALFHELGHIVTALLLGVRLRVYRAGAVGVSLGYDTSTVSLLTEAAVCLSGPVLGLSLFFICRRLGVFSHFAAANAALSFFNLLPVSGLDGGGALLCLTDSIMPPHLSLRLSRAVSSAVTLALWCISVYVLLRIRGDISSAVVSLYLLYRLFSDS